MNIEKIYRNEDDAKRARRVLISRGRRVSLIAFDPSRNAYVFDVLS